MKVKLSELEALKGGEPAAAYELAKKFNFKVRAIGDEMLPTKLFFKTIYIRVNDLDLIEGAWASENNLEYDSL